MPRFSDPPVKNPLSGSESLAATDPSTMDDVSMTPLIITQFAQRNMTLATGSTNGLVSGPNGDKLSALYTKAQLDSKITQLAQVSFPIFVAAPSNGSQFIYTHVGNNWTFDFGWVTCATGTTNVTVLIGSTPMTGATNVPVSAIPTLLVISAQNLLTPANQLGFALGSTSGNCTGFVCSLHANATIT